MIWEKGSIKDLLLISEIVTAMRRVPADTITSLKPEKKDQNDEAKMIFEYPVLSSSNQVDSLLLETIQDHKEGICSITVIQFIHQIHSNGIINSAALNKNRIICRCSEKYLDKSEKYQTPPEEAQNLRGDGDSTKTDTNRAEPCDAQLKCLDVLWKKQWKSPHMMKPKHTLSTVQDRKSVHVLCGTWVENNAKMNHVVPRVVSANPESKGHIEDKDLVRAVEP
ncbi:uncharacterized protein V6R79_012374 [Siganus canaliculatus]